MGEENPIRTLRDYSKPSLEGYRNTIELLEGNNVVPLRSDTIRLVQNGCSFYELWSEDPNQHLKDFPKLVDSLDLNGDNRERTRLLKAISLPQDVLSTFDRRLIKLENQVQCLMKAHLAPKQPVQVNKISSSCKICSGPHDTQYCMENPSKISLIMRPRVPTKREGSMKPSATECKDNKVTIEAEEEVEEKSEEEFKEETKDETEEEEEDDPKYFDTFPTMEELGYHGWLLKNP
nr:zinc finger, CCHC-type [Tanacetum cinerariifolium]